MTRYDSSYPRYYTMTSGLLVGYKATLLRGMSSRVFFVHRTVTYRTSPLISIIYLLPKDQTLKRVIKQLRSRLTLPNTSHPEQTTLRSIRLSVIPEDRSSASFVLDNERPCSVVTQEHSPNIERSHDDSHRSN